MFQYLLASILCEILDKFYVTLCQKFQKFVDNNVLPLHLKQTFLTIIWIFTEVEEDGIKSRLSL